MDAHDHEHEAAPGHEAFPRRWLASMIASDAATDSLRARLQWLAFGLALAFFALACPTRALIGEGPELVEGTANGAWIAVHLALAPLARCLASAPRIRIEQAWFILSALSWGASGWVLAAALQRHGFKRLTAIVASAIAITCPAAWTAATLPGPAAPALAGATWVFAALLDAPRSDDQRAQDRRIAWAWVGALSLDVRALWLAPAIAAQALHSARRAGLDPSPRFFERALAQAKPFALYAALVLLASSILPSTPSDGFFRALFSALGGRGTATVGSVWLSVFGIGAAAFGLLVLLLPPATPEESRAPWWLAVWIAAPLAVPTFIGHVDLSSVSMALAPVAALGLCKWLDERDLASFTRHAILLLVGQLAIDWGFGYGIRSKDSGDDWSAVAARQFEPRDLVITLSKSHAYLVRHRFVLRVVDLNEVVGKPQNVVDAWWSSVSAKVRACADAGGRAVFDLGEDFADYPFTAEVQRLRALAPNVDLRIRP